MRRPIAALLAVGLAVVFAPPAAAFCGFFVAKADTKMFNKVSRVAIARAENRTVITMANDYRGEPTEFGLVIPTPVVLQETQVNVAEPALMEHLDAYTAPRLVEYFDRDPCETIMLRERMMATTAVPAQTSAATDRAKALGVTVEAEYTVGEYDIQILSGTQSSGLLTFLTENGYKLPAGAEPVVGGYIRQGMKFFVAKVNLKKHAALNASYLRPLQIAFESDKFMLPIRLGTLSADGEQELYVFTLTQQGRVESANYRTVEMPTGMDIPIFVKEEFADFYRAMFKEQVRKNPGVAFVEYAWDMNWCDPCAADPLSRLQLRTLGAWWVRAGDGQVRPPGVPAPRPGQPRIRIAPGPQPVNVFVTRMHMRYSGDQIKDDIAFKETPNRENFQGRYVLRHPWTGEASCPAAKDYRKRLADRWEKEAQTLASLTAWPITEIRAKQPKLADLPPEKPWWEQIWNK